MSDKTIDIEQIVGDRYSGAAREKVDSLCCAPTYDPAYLEVIPAEILERDYGCGDSTRTLGPGDTVLDLGSGGGKACYIAAQVVGRNGSVIGIDMNKEMLALAERHREAIGDCLGYHNVRFCRGKIQDLALDLSLLEQYLERNPVHDPAGLDEVHRWIERQRREAPLIGDESVDVVVSNCVVNLVRHSDRNRLFRELHRVLRAGGRAVISDIVADADIPADLQVDPELWSGCISGAFREDLFLAAFERAGFREIRVVRRDAKPWQVHHGIEFRSVTVEAFHASEGRTTGGSCC